MKSDTTTILFPKPHKTPREGSRILDTTIVFFEGNLAAAETAQNLPGFFKLLIKTHFCDYSRLKVHVK